MIIHPKYTKPIASVPQVHNVHNSGNDDWNGELTGIEPLYTSMCYYGPSVPPKDTSEPLEFGPVPSYVFNQRLSSCQAK